MSVLDFDTTLGTTVKTYPITVATTLSPGLMSEVDFLRIAQDKGLKDFLGTIFSSEEIAEYFDKSSIKTNNNQVSEVSDKQILKNKLRQSIKTEANKTRSIHRQNPKLMTNYKNLVDLSDETIDEKIEVTTMSKRKETDSVDISTNDTNLEDDIKTLIDQLDLNEMLQPAENSDGKDNAESDKKFKEKKKIRLNVDLSGSDESRTFINSNQESVLKYLLESKEDKVKQVLDDDDGSSKSSKNFKDPSLRDTQPSDNNIKDEKLTEQSIFDMISLALEEERKHQSKGLHFSL